MADAPEGIERRIEIAGLYNNAGPVAVVSLMRDFMDGIEPGDAPWNRASAILVAAMQDAENNASSKHLRGIVWNLLRILRTIGDPTAVKYLHDVETAAGMNPDDQDDYNSWVRSVFAAPYHAEMYHQPNEILEAIFGDLLRVIKVELNDNNVALTRVGDDFYDYGLKYRVNFSAKDHIGTYWLIRVNAFAIEAKGLEDSYASEVALPALRSVFGSLAPATMNGVTNPIAAFDLTVVQLGSFDIAALYYAQMPDYRMSPQLTEADYEVGRPSVLHCVTQAMQVRGIELTSGATSFNAKELAARNEESHEFFALYFGNSYSAEMERELLNRLLGGISVLQEDDLTVQLYKLMMEAVPAPTFDLQSSAEETRERTHIARQMAKVLREQSKNVRSYMDLHRLFDMAERSIRTDHYNGILAIKKARNAYYYRMSDVIVSFWQTYTERAPDANVVVPVREADVLLAFPNDPQKSAIYASLREYLRNRAGNNVGLGHQIALENRVIDYMEDSLRAWDMADNNRIRAILQHLGKSRAMLLQLRRAFLDRHASMNSSSFSVVNDLSKTAAFSGTYLLCGIPTVEVSYTDYDSIGMPVKKRNVALVRRSAVDDAIVHEQSKNEAQARIISKLRAERDRTVVRNAIHTVTLARLKSEGVSDPLAKALSRNVLEFDWTVGGGSGEEIVPNTFDPYSLSELLHVPSTSYIATVYVHLYDSKLHERQVSIHDIAAGPLKSSRHVFVPGDAIDLRSAVREDGDFLFREPAAWNKLGAGVPVPITGKSSVVLPPGTNYAAQIRKYALDALIEDADRDIMVMQPHVGHSIIDAISEAAKAGLDGDGDAVMMAGSAGSVDRSQILLSEHDELINVADEEAEERRKRDAFPRKTWAAPWHDVRDALLSMNVMYGLSVERYATAGNVIVDSSGVATERFDRYAELLSGKRGISAEAQNSPFYFYYRKMGSNGADSVAIYEQKQIDDLFGIGDYAACLEAYARNIQALKSFSVANLAVEIEQPRRTALAATFASLKWLDPLMAFDRPLYDKIKFGLETVPRAISLFGFGEPENRELKRPSNGEVIMPANGENWTDRNLLTYLGNVAKWADLADNQLPPVDEYMRKMTQEARLYDPQLFGRRYSIVRTAPLCYTRAQTTHTAASFDIAPERTSRDLVVPVEHYFAPLFARQQYTHPAALLRRVRVMFMPSDAAGIESRKLTNYSLRVNTTAGSVEFVIQRPKPSNSGVYFLYDHAGTLRHSAKYAAEHDIAVGKRFHYSVALGVRVSGELFSLAASGVDVAKVQQRMGLSAYRPLAQHGAGSVQELDVNGNGRLYYNPFVHGEILSTDRLRTGDVVMGQNRHALTRTVGLQAPRMSDAAETMIKIRWTEKPGAERRVIEWQHRRNMQDWPVGSNQPDPAARRPLFALPRYYFNPKYVAGANLLAMSQSAIREAQNNASLTVYGMPYRTPLGRSDLMRERGGNLLTDRTFGMARNSVALAHHYMYDDPEVMNDHTMEREHARLNAVAWVCFFDPKYHRDELERQRNEVSRYAEPYDAFRGMFGASDIDTAQDALYRRLVDLSNKAVKAQRRAEQAPDTDWKAQTAKNRAESLLNDTLEEYESLYQMPSIEDIVARVPKTMQLFDADVFLASGTVLCCREQNEAKCTQWYQSVIDAKRAIVDAFRRLEKAMVDASSDKEKGRLATDAYKELKERVCFVLRQQNRINEANGFRAKIAPENLCETVADLIASQIYLSLLFDEELAKTKARRSIFAEEFANKIDFDMGMYAVRKIVSEIENPGEHDDDDDDDDDEEL
jgi:hypothetical protein